MQARALIGGPSGGRFWPDLFSGPGQVSSPFAGGFSLPIRRGRQACGGARGTTTAAAVRLSCRASGTIRAEDRLPGIRGVSTWFGIRRAERHDRRRRSSTSSYRRENNGPVSDGTPGIKGAPPPISGRGRLHCDAGADHPWLHLWPPKPRDVGQGRVKFAGSKQSKDRALSGAGPPPVRAAERACHAASMASDWRGFCRKIDCVTVGRA